MQSFKPAYSGEQSKQPTNFITSSDYSVASRYLMRVAVIYTFERNLPDWDYIGMPTGQRGSMWDIESCCNLWSFFSYLFGKVLDVRRHGRKAEAELC